MTTPDTKAIRARMEALAGLSVYHSDLPIVEPNWHIAPPENKIRMLANVRIEPGNAVDVANASLIAATADMRETILALCAEVDELRADIETCTAKRDEWADRAMTELGNVLDLRAENERLRRMLDLRGTGPAERYWEGRWRDEAADNERLRNFIVDFSETKFDRIDRRSPDPQDDLDPLTDYLAIEAWQEDARAALAQKGGE